MRKTVLQLYANMSAEYLFQRGIEAGMIEAAADYFRHAEEIGLDVEVDLDTGSVLGARVSPSYAGEMLPHYDGLAMKRPSITPGFKVTRADFTAEHLTAEHLDFASREKRLDWWRKRALRLQALATGLIEFVHLHCGPRNGTNVSATERIRYDQAAAKFLDQMISIVEGSIDG
jgi:hypothetical protein